VDCALSVIIIRKGRNNYWKNVYNNGSEQGKKIGQIFRIVAWKYSTIDEPCLGLVKNLHFVLLFCILNTSFTQVKELTVNFNGINSHNFLMPKMLHKIVLIRFLVHSIITLFHCATFNTFLIDRAIQKHISTH
jgi:hypothetical protein